MTDGSFASVSILTPCFVQGRRSASAPAPARRAPPAVLSECLRRNRLQNATLRLTITRGRTPSDLALKPIRRTVSLRPSRSPRPASQSPVKGVAAVVIRRFRADRRVSPQQDNEPAPGAPGPPGSERRRRLRGILLNEKGEITEGTTTNVFWVGRERSTRLPSAPASFRESREPSHWRRAPGRRTCPPGNREARAAVPRRRGLPHGNVDRSPSAVTRR